jgi:hypothetical protein
MRCDEGFDTGLIPIQPQLFEQRLHIIGLRIHGLTPD